MTLPTLGVGVLLALVGSAVAQERAGSAAEGHRFVETYCSGCHPVELRVARAGGIAPDFVTIASRPSITKQSLTEFFQSSHPLMPNFRLTQEEANDVIAYILSLKHR